MINDLPVGRLNGTSKILVGCLEFELLRDLISHMAAVKGSIINLSELVSILLEKYWLTLVLRYK